MPAFTAVVLIEDDLGDEEMIHEMLQDRLTNHRSDYGIFDHAEILVVEEVQE